MQQNLAAARGPREMARFIEHRGAGRVPHPEKLAGPIRGSAGAAQASGMTAGKTWPGPRSRRF